VNLICAAHPELSATARCVSCGHHLCDSCRLLIGIRNFCVRCFSAHRPRAQVPMKSLPPSPPRATAAALAVRIEAAPPSRKSPWVAAVFSIIPGLGQLWTGRVLRGVTFFAAALALNAQAILPPLMGLFLFVFNLWDAWRLAENHNLRLEKSAVRSRWDDTLFTVAGFGVIAWTVFELGGIAQLSGAAIAALSAIAASLLFVQETRN